MVFPVLRGAINCGMNWQHLNYFRVLAESDGFSQAAEELYITPSALSKAIALLEEELQCPLFERVGRKSVLTKCGKIFLEYVTKALNDIDEGIEQVRHELSPYSGEVKIGSVFGLNAFFVPYCISAYMQKYPQSTFSSVYLPTLKIVQKLAFGELDVGLCGDSGRFFEQIQNYPTLNWQMINQKSLSLLVYSTHPLAGCGRIDFRDLRNEKFICSSLSKDNEYLFKLCGEAGFTPNITLFAMDRVSIISMVEHKLGIALVNSSNLSQYPGSLISIPIESDYALGEYIVWNRSRVTPVAEAFRHLVVEKAREISSGRFGPNAGT